MMQTKDRTQNLPTRIDSESDRASLLWHQKWNILCRDYLQKEREKYSTDIELRNCPTYEMESNRLKSGAAGTAVRNAGAAIVDYFVDAITSDSRRAQNNAIAQ